MHIRVSFVILLLFSALVCAAGDTILRTDSHIQADEGGIFLIKKSVEKSQQISIEPDTNAVYTAYEFLKRQGYRVDVGAQYKIEEDKDDLILDMSYRVLYAGSKIGMYIGITKGSELEKFVISNSFKPKYGKLRISAGLLKKLSSIYIYDYDIEHQEKVRQNSIGIEYRYINTAKSILKEIKTTALYYDLNGKKLGNISDILLDNDILYDWDTTYGKYTSGQKMVADISAVFKVQKNIKAEAGLGYEQSDYNLLYERLRQSNIKIPSFLSLSYRMSKRSQLDFYIKNAKKRITKLRYTKNFKNGLKSFISAERKTEEAFAETVYRFGFEYSFGGNLYGGKLEPLFETKKTQKTLLLQDLSPITDINNNDFTTLTK